MTPTEFKKARQSLGLTREELASILNVTPSAIRKWEAPDGYSTARSTNPIACKVMSWMVNGFKPSEYGG
jgi:DNA-binding transcriptional regulator YiaG